MGQELIQHGKLGSKHIHKVTNWRFQDTDSRMDVANQFTAYDIDKMCYDMETERYYILKSIHPSSGVPTWYDIPENIGVGEANTLTAVGSGATLVAGKVGVDLQIKTLVEGNNVTFTMDAETVTINANVPEVDSNVKELQLLDNIGGHTVVSYHDPGSVNKTDINSFTSCRTIAGITLGAGVTFAYVPVKYYGFIVSIGWFWIPGADIFLGDNGQLTQEVPTSGHIVKMGTAMDNTSMLVDIQPLIKLL